MAIVGPTAVGKTALAVALCRRTGGEIVSIDSRQIYRGIEVASNAPTAEDLAGITCHLVSVLEPDVATNAAAYAQMARTALQEIDAHGKVTVFTAGSGLYLRAILDGLDLGGAGANPILRTELEQKAGQDLAALVSELETAFPGATSNLDTKNPVRVVRRYEIAVAEREGRVEPGRFEVVRAVKVGLDAPHWLLADWIAERTDRMLDGRLQREVEELLRRERHPVAQVLRGIGVEEMAGHLTNHVSLEAVRERIIKRTVDYAKRQRTWFRADPEVTWFEVGDEPRSDIVEAIVELMR